MFFSLFVIIFQFTILKKSTFFPLLFLTPFWEKYSISFYFFQKWSLLDQSLIFILMYMTALLKYLYLLKIFCNHQSPNSKINKKWWQIWITLSLHTLKYFYFLNSEFLQMKIHKLIKRLMKTFSSIFNNGIDFIYCWWNQFWLKFLLI